MVDYDRFADISGMFDDLNDTVSEYIRQPGVAAARDTIHRRRRNRIVLLAVVVMMLIAGPAVAFASSGDLGDTGADGADGARTRIGAAAMMSREQSRPDVGASPGGAASSDPRPDPDTRSSRSRASASAQPSRTRPVPDGRISPADLETGTIQIPAWPVGLSEGCASGAMTLAGGSASGGYPLALVGAPVYVDVDGDGSQETAVVIECRPQGSDYKVMVFDRDATGGIVTVGQVVGTVGSTGTRGVDILKIWQIAAAGNDQIRVDVGDYRPCCSMPKDVPQHQWRTYGFNGKGFVQTGGPTAFGPNPKVDDIRVSAPDPVLAKQADGTWKGTWTVSVTNRGLSTIPVTVTLTPDAALTVTSTGCLGDPDPTGSDNRICLIGDVTAGSSVAVTYNLTSAPVPAPAPAVVPVPAGNLVITATHGYYPLVANPRNTMTVTVKPGTP
jgi:hypothetical protein